MCDIMGCHLLLVPWPTINRLIAKDDVRLAIGRSPDKSDALAMSVYQTEAAFSYGGAAVGF
jgi:hypothetical protein